MPGWLANISDRVWSSLWIILVPQAEPTHPELLDHLATRFMDDHWSVKSLIRSIVLSRTYRLSGQHAEANASMDEGDRLYWRANLRRLEAEDIRDSLLAAGGMLQTERPVSGSFEGSYNVDLSRIKPGKREVVSDPIAEPVPAFISRSCVRGYLACSRCSTSPTFMEKLPKISWRDCRRRWNVLQIVATMECLANRAVHHESDWSHAEREHTSSGRFGPSSTGARSTHLAHLLCCDRNIRCWYRCRTRCGRR